MRNYIDLIESAQQQLLLIVVHPGSACGSADFNLGRQEARAEREYLASDIMNWDGGVLIVDGELSDELPQYSELDGAIKSALTKAKNRGLISERIYACDNTGSPTHGGNWCAAVAASVAHLPRDIKVEITGIWYFENDEAGCVNAVYDTLSALGFSPQVRDSAIRDPGGNDYEDDEDE